ncbi:MAG: phage integrase SAM-like domain-containing protein [Muribaculaceae bacterium]|nr:phage integrase SAM-like domain-containing protein [Muribaculaceae bacterium]
MNREDFYPQITRKSPASNMMTLTTSLYLDRRSVLANGESPLKISVTKKGSTAYIPLGITLLPSQWDAVRKRVIAHPRKSFLNAYLAQKKLEVDEIVLLMNKVGGFARKTVTTIKNEIISKLKGEDSEVVTFASRLTLYIEQCDALRTAEIYRATERRLKEFMKKSYTTLMFEDMTVDWLNRFDQFLAKTSPARNARNIHFRNIRAIFNDARRNRLTSEYPFGKGLFEIRPEKTRKRSLSVEVLRELFSAKLDSSMEKYRDIFNLIFLLIAIHFIDLCRLEYISDRRIEFIAV